MNKTNRPTEDRAALERFDAALITLFVGFVLACGGVGNFDDGGGGYNREPEASDEPADEESPDEPQDDDEPEELDDDDAADDVDEEEEPEDEEDPDCEGAKEVSVTYWLSADDSNSQADPARVRLVLQQGIELIGQPKVHEFLNYYSFDYPRTHPGSLLVVPELRELDGERGEYELAVGVVAPVVTPEDRRPLNLVFSVDTSGSMGGEGIASARAVIEAVASQLRTGDIVSVVTWSTEKTWPLDSHEVSGPNDEALLAASAGLVADGGTDLNLGLTRAYAQAFASYDEGRINRVLLITDGGANVGVTDAELIASAAEDSEQEGIYLVGVGAGQGFNDPLLTTVTDLGKGAYVYIDTPAEAEAMFTGYRLLANLEVAARDVQLVMTLPPRFVMTEFHGEGDVKVPEAIEPQHLSPNDSMIFHLELDECGAEGDPTFLFEVTYVDPITREARSVMEEWTLQGLLAEPAPRLAKASAIVAYAEALGAVQELPQNLRYDYLAGVYEEVAAVAADQPEDADLAEVTGLLALYRDRFEEVEEEEPGDDDDSAE